MDAKIQSLYGIQNDYMALFQELMDAEGELTPELEKALAVNAEEFEGKASNYAGLIRYLEAQTEGLKAELDRIKEFIGSNTNKIDRLKHNLQTALEMRGGEPVTVGTFRISLRSSTSVNIVDEEKIPKKLIVKKVTTAPDKKEIAILLKAGKKVPGAELQSKKHLQLK